MRIENMAHVGKTLLGKIEDTYAEAFDGIYTRVCITAYDEKILHAAADDSTATPAVVFGRTEGGVERYLNKMETPDGCVGAILQFWTNTNPQKPFAEVMKKFGRELSYRFRQDILVKPFTSIFNALPNAEGKIDMMEIVGHCGDGYEWTEQSRDREIITVPLMVPNFNIERSIGYARGVTGGNFWIYCKTKEAVMESGEKALEAIHKIPEVITPFDICSAGSKPETKFPLIGPTTNHPYCPSLRQKLGTASKVPANVEYIPEIVINGTSLNAVKAAMKSGIEAVLDMDDVVGVSAGNYEGKLGQHKIYLQKLFT